MATNVAAERFCKSLWAAVGGRVFADTKTFYIGKLSKWYLTEDQWARALSAIVADLRPNERGDVSLPTLADICDKLKVAQAGARPTSGVHWLTFTMPNGHRYAMRVHDPSRPPKPPEGATELHLVIDEQLQAPPEEYSARRPASDMTPIAKVIEHEFTFPDGEF